MVEKVEMSMTLNPLIFFLSEAQNLVTTVLFYLEAI